MKDTRAVTRSVRTPINIDDKIREHAIDKGLSYTDSMLDLVQIGLRVLDFKNEIEANPEMEKEIENENKGTIRALLNDRFMAEETKKISTNQLKLAIMKCSVELNRRENEKEERLARSTVIGLKNTKRGGLDLGETYY